MDWLIHDNSTGKIVATIPARNAREALLKYLMDHEELDDMMFWKSADHGDSWKLAPYDQGEDFLYARINVAADSVWELFRMLPMSSDMQIVNKEGEILAESYGSLSRDDFDNARIVSLKPDPNNCDMYTVVIEIPEEDEHELHN